MTRFAARVATYALLALILLAAAVAMNADFNPAEADTTARTTAEIATG